MRSAWAYVIGVVLLIGLFSLPSVTAGLAGAARIASENRNTGLQLAELKEQLTFGLRARTSRDRLFIDRVVSLVRAEEMPLEMVESTFIWARRKQPYPFPYFERALRIRAAEAGIDI